MCPKYIFKKMLAISSSLAMMVASFSLSFGEVVLKNDNGNAFTSVDKFVAGNGQENTEAAVPLFCSDKGDPLEGVKVRYLSKERVSKNLDKDYPSLKSLSDYFERHGLSISNNLENASGFRLNFTDKVIPDEWKANLIAKSGTDMTHGFMVRDVYDRDTEAIVGQVVYSRGKFEDGTFIAIANIEKDGQKSTYFSNGSKSEHILATEGNKRSKRGDEVSCGICRIGHMVACEGLSGIACEIACTSLVLAWPAMLSCFLMCATAAGRFCSIPMNISCKSHCNF